MNSYYWYQRLLPLLPGAMTTIEFDPKVNWRQVYNILRATRWHNTPTSAEGMRVIVENEYNPVALSILKAIEIPLGPTLSSMLVPPSSLRSDSVDGCLELASLGVSEISLLTKLKEHGSNFNDNHFYMLLKQLIFHRKNRTDTSDEDSPTVPVSTNGVSLTHYINWMLIQLTSPRTSSSVKQLFGAAADSILYARLLSARRTKVLLYDEPVVHSSPEFTAYSSFLLLAFTTDWNWILRAATEEGATSQGVELAGMLLGAFLGKRRLLAIA